MILQEQLKAKDIRHQTMKTLKKHLTIEAEGYRCQTEMLYDILLKGSAENSSIEAVCGDLVDVADSNTVREHLNNAVLLQKIVVKCMQVG